MSNAKQQSILDFILAPPVLCVRLVGQRLALVHTLSAQAAPSIDERCVLSQLKALLHDCSTHLSEEHRDDWKLDCLFPELSQAT